MPVDALEWKHVVLGLTAVALLLVGASVAASFYTDVNPSVGRLAVIEVSGAIAHDTGPQSAGISPDKLESMTSQAEDDRADAIIYEINSPGGSVVASKDATRVIEETDVPTVCLFREVAASGAYWMASACDHIVADSMTMTGSIGVSSAYLEFSGLLDQYGVEYVNLTAGEYKDMGSRYRNITSDEREKFDDMLDTVHTAFIEDIAENRDMPVAQVEEAATGEIMLGTDAKDRGLVDELGSYDTAEDRAKEMTGVDRFRTTEYSPPEPFQPLSLLFSKIGEGIADGLKMEEDPKIRAEYP